MKGDVIIFNPYGNSKGSEGYFKRKSFEEKKELSKANEPILYEKLIAKGDWEGGLFHKNGNLIELRISRTAVHNQPCGLKEKTIHEWLYTIGKKHVKEGQDFETVLITSADVSNGELTETWDKLIRVDQ